jgi:lipopolysaccharide export system permease protein
MKASGISLYTMFVPVLIFAVATTSLTFFLYVKALPWGNHNFRVALYELARTKAAVGTKEGLKEHVFNETFPGLVIYIDEIDNRDNTFKNVMISDSRDEKTQQTIFANKGELITDEKALRVILRLYQGVSHPKSVTQSVKYHIGAFPVLDILLSLQDEQGKRIIIPPTDRDMTLSQLIGKYFVLKQQEAQPNQPQPQPQPEEEISGFNKLTRYCQATFQLLWDSFSIQGRSSSSYLVETHKRFSIPFACIVFGLIATPLGIQSQRAGKSGGYAISIVLLLVYYIFITAGESLGDDGKLPVFLAVWPPNILLGITGLFLLVRIAKR